MVLPQGAFLALYIIGLLADCLLQASIPLGVVTPREGGSTYICSGVLSTGDSSCVAYSSTTCSETNYISTWHVVGVGGWQDTRNNPPFTHRRLTHTHAGESIPGPHVHDPCCVGCTCQCRCLRHSIATAAARNADDLHQTLCVMLPPSNMSHPTFPLPTRCLRPHVDAPRSFH